MNETFILAPVCVPIVAGIILEILKKTEKMRMNLFVAAVLAIESVLVFINTGKIGSEVTLFSITDNLPVYFKIDKLGIIKTMENITTDRKLLLEFRISNL